VTREQGHVIRPDNRIRSIAIIGGGAAGWLSAATLSRILRPDYCAIRVLQVPQPHSGQISEATNPAFHRLTGLLGIDAAQLMRDTQATFSLGAEFRDWGRSGERYFHTFGPFGARLESVPFHHYWSKLRQLGDARTLEEFSVATVAARAGRFALPAADQRSVLSLFSYGYHLDAELLAAYLRSYAEQRGVVGIAPGVVDVELRAADGFLAALKLEDQSRIEADLFIDCSGGRGLSIPASLDAGYEDWSHWLPCDRAVAIACAGDEDPRPYSQAIAHANGWQWRVPLRHRVDTGYAYSARLLSDEEAVATARASLPGRALTEPRLLRFVSGRPARFWIKNYLSLPGSALPPLEAVRLHLVQTGISRLLTLFPDRSFNPGDADEYNRLTITEHERIRDFLILHFKASTRADSPFWQNCRNMRVPDTLRGKIELFESSGRLSPYDDEHFGDDNWLSVLLGQNIVPHSYDPLVDIMDIEQVRAALAQVQSAIHQAVNTMPAHGRYLEQYCGLEAARAL
jgi:tryptophan 7-halogenase